MSEKSRIYLVLSQKTGQGRLIRAISMAAATKFVASDLTTRIASQDDLVTGIALGVKVEDIPAAGATAAAPAAATTTPALAPNSVTPAQPNMAPAAAPTVPNQIVGGILESGGTAVPAAGGTIAPTTGLPELAQQHVDRQAAAALLAANAASGMPPPDMAPAEPVPPIVLTSLAQEPAAA